MKGYVYLICNPQTEAFKIGVTTVTTKKRLKELQTGNDNALHVVTFHKSNRPFVIEGILHRKFYPKHKLNEWFNLDGFDVFNFEEECGKIEKMLDDISDNPFVRL